MIRRWLWGVVGVGLLGAAVFWAFAPRPIAVDAVRAVVGPLAQTVDEEGKTRVRDRYVISTPVAGRLLRINIDVGDSVRRGELLATIVPSPPQLLDARTRAELSERVGAAAANVERTKATLGRAKASATQASADLARSEDLRKRGFVSPAQVERDTLTLELARRDVAISESALDAAQHELAQARAALAGASAPAGRGASDLVEVRAPIDGHVLKVVQESEAVLAPGTSLLELGDPHELEIVVDVLSTDAVAILPGAPVAIERWGGHGEVVARVRRVEPRAFTKVSALGVEEQRVSVIVDVIRGPEAWSRVGDAYRVLARIRTGGVDDTVIVPAGALIRTRDAWQVFVAQEGTAHLRAVGIALRSSTHAALSAGVEAGEQVVVYPPSSLADGARVRVR